MKLTLKNFKCWSDLALEIPIGAIVLLKAPSGSGKSSILKSIDWVLYGHVKKISPHSMKHAKTQVKYEVNNITITRTKHPNKLIFDDGIQFEDAEAQKKINFIYGEYDVWLSTSYVAQRLQNHFLISPNTGKMELLNKIAFHEQDPNEYLEKIDLSYNDARTEQQCLLKSYLEKLEQTELFSVEISKHVLSTNKVNILNDRLTFLNKKLVEVTELKQKQNMMNAIKNNKIEELNKIIRNT